jgi:hypothetical protein
MVVRESVDEVLQRIIEYKRLVFSDWPVKKFVRVPADNQSFSWIEADGLLPLDEANSRVLQDYPHLQE